MSEKKEPDPIPHTYLEKLNAAKEKAVQTRGAVARNKIQAVCHLAAMGIDPGLIAEQLGCSRSSVNSVIKSDSGSREIERIRERLFMQEPNKMFQSIAVKAVQVAYAAMMDKKTKTQTKVDAAFKFIERAYGKPKQEIEHTGSTLKDLILALDGGEKSKQDIEDAEYKTVEEKFSQHPGGISEESSEEPGEEPGKA